MSTKFDRRSFMGYFAGAGLTSTLFPGVLWAKLSAGADITVDTIASAEEVAGVHFDPAERELMLDGLKQQEQRIEALHKVSLPNSVSPATVFNPLPPGKKVVVEKPRPMVRSKVAHRSLSGDPEDLAFLPVTELSELVRRKRVTSVELTQMYLSRLKRYDPVLRCVITLTEDRAFEKAHAADAEIRRGKYRGPLHGIPWGAKDIITVKGFKTTWGSDAYKDQMLDEEASVVEMLREAGAVLLAKLVSGELAQGDRWFGGTTKNPWNPAEGSSGSSAGPGSATAGGLVGFAIGTETSGSKLSPAGRCGVTGLRPTFGRISRYGVMALSWTQDRLGPMCRYAEDCAMVMGAIARPDGRDLSVSEIPFNWNAHLDIRKLRVGFLQEAFDETRDPVLKRNEEKTLEQVQGLGFNLIPVKAPDWTLDVSSYGVESAVFFDELIRSGGDKKLTNPGRASGWRTSRTTPAVEYLQAQRARTMMMMKLADATAGVDVYLVPTNTGGGPPGGRRTRPRRWRRKSAPDRYPASLQYGEFRLLSGDLHAEWIYRGWDPGRHHSLRAAVRRSGATGGGEGVSGRLGVSPEAS